MATKENADLAAKLDADFEKFVSQCKPKTSSDAWPEDNWEENKCQYGRIHADLALMCYFPIFFGKDPLSKEMEKHPLFMSKLEDGQDLPPLVEAMQQLKYDPDLNTPLELAKSYKEEGNEDFKLKKYRRAVISYTEGLKLQCEDNDLNAVLYTNRATCHFYIGNYEKALKDAIEAIALKPGHGKAYAKAAQSCMKLKRFEDCIQYCTQGLEVEKTNDTLIKSFNEWQSEATNKKKIANRDKRKALAAATKEAKKWNKIKSIIKERGIHFDEENQFKKQDLGPECLSSECKIELQDDGSLMWPVVLLYPEYQLTDFITDFHDDQCFKDHLAVILSEENRPSWDTEHKYVIENLKVYYIHDLAVIEVDLNQSLKSLMSHKSFVATVPLMFYITVKNTPFDRFFTSEMKSKREKV